MQEDIHITGKEALPEQHHGAALTAHNLAQFLGLPHHAEAPARRHLHRDSCATAIHDDSWQARGAQSPRWLPASLAAGSAEGSPVPSRPSSRTAEWVATSAASAGGDASGRAESGGIVHTDAALALQRTSAQSSDSSGEAAPAHAGDALKLRSQSASMSPEEDLEDSAADAAAAVAGGAPVGTQDALMRDDNAEEFGERGSESSSSATPRRTSLQPVHTTLFRPSAGATVMPAISEAQAASMRVLPDADLGAPSADTAAARLARKSQQKIAGGKIVYHDGRPKLGPLFEAVEGQAQAAGCDRVAVMVCGNKHLLRNCLKLVGQRQNGAIKFEAHYESFGFV